MRKQICWIVVGICVLLTWAVWVWKPSTRNNTLQGARPLPSSKLAKPPEARQEVQVAQASRLLSGGHLPPLQVSEQNKPSRARLVAAYGKLPLSFEVNQGQTNSAVKFMSRGSGYTLFLTGDEAVLGLQKSGVRNQEPGARHRRFGLNSRFGIRNAKFETRNSEFGIGLPGSLLARLQSPISSLESPISNLQSPISNFKSPAAPPGPDTEPQAPTALRMKLVGANPKAVAMGAEELPGKVNYFIGNDPKKWRTNVPTYAKVKYHDVYPGVDLVYYGNQGGQLEYDFVVAPGADPKAIVLDVGAGLVPARGRPQGSPLQIANDGDLIIPTGDGELRFHRPTVYQEESTVDSRQLAVNADEQSSSARHSSLVTRHSIDGRFTLDAENRIHFTFGPYDHSQPLVIDPVLVYSTYLGGSGGFVDGGTYGDSANGIAVDSFGNAYITGSTASANYPTANPLQANLRGGFDAFVTKLNAAGSALVYSTYLGGSNDDGGGGIAVDSAGNAYVVGSTASGDFPTVNPFQAYKLGEFNVFVAKLNAAGSALLYSTYLGGSRWDVGVGIALDSSGCAYVTGSTESNDFPLANPYQAQNLGGAYTVFISKFSPSGSALVYSTYLGGNLEDFGRGIAVDSAGSAYITGNSWGNFPMANPLPGIPAQASGFVAKLGWNGSALSLVYSTYLGGSNGDCGFGIAVDSSGNAYVTGETNSTDFPTANPFQPSLGGRFDAFVTKLAWNGSALSLAYSTYLGGSDDDVGNAIAVDSSGNAYVTGSTTSPNFPTLNPIQAQLAGQGNAFVAEFNPAGSALVYSTYLGGSGGDEATGVAVDAAGNAFETGSTSSTNFPTVNPFQATLPSNYGSAFIAKIAPANGPAASLSSPTLSFGPEYVGDSSAAQTVTVTNVGSSPLSISNITIGGSSAFTQTNNYSAPLQGLGTATISVTYTPTALGPQTATLTITDNDSGVPGSTQTVTLTGTGVSALGGVSSSSLSFGSQSVGTASAPQPVVLSNPNTTALAVSISVSANYLETDNCGGVVAGPGACTINVSFKPTAVGQDNGTLAVVETSNGQPVGTASVALSGVGFLTEAGKWVPGYQFLAAGSSAQFNLTAIASLDPGATPRNNTPCTGGNPGQHWANTSGMAIRDPRGYPNLSDEAGPVWIGWDSDFITGMDYNMGLNGVNAPPTGVGIICAYVSLDSVVGLREYFANGQFVLSATANTPDASNVAVPGLPAGSNLPPEVVYFFNSLGPQVVNVAPTDIRPEDGKFATLRAMLTPTGAKGPANYPGLGYGACIGAPIQDTFPGSSTIMQVADFIIDPRDVDCLTSSSTPRSYNLVPVGAAPVLVLVNSANTGAGHTGNAEYSQINSTVLANIFTGRNLAVRDIGNNSSDPVVPLTVFQSEPLSGAYNTFDFNITCAKAQYLGWGGVNGYRCQETGVDPNSCPTPGVNCGNPMFISTTLANGAGTAVRRRAIGTGNMVAAICGSVSPYSTGWPDSIGYAFWSFSTFNGDQANCRYLPVDNIDPLYPYPSDNPGGIGTLPTCTSWSSPLNCPVLPFTHVLDGSYPIWSMYRWVYQPPSSTTYGTNVNNVLYYVQKAAETYYTDLVPAQDPDTGANMLNVFHSHYVTTVTDAYGAEYGSNGVATVFGTEPETGGDMGGQVLTVSSEIDYALEQQQAGVCTAAVWPGLGYPGACQQTNLQK